MSDPTHTPTENARRVAEPSAVERTRFSTMPPQRPTPFPGRNSAGGGFAVRRLGRGRILSLLALGLVLIAGLAMALSSLSQGAGPGRVTMPIAVTLTVFLLAVWAWTSTGLDDTLVAFLAAIALIVTGVLPASDFFASLGDETIWLLIGAFVIASAVSSSGLALRGASHLLRFARGPRSLFHLTTVALTLTAFAVPATSGRAALAVPVHTAVAAALPGRERVIRALALLMPTVVLLSAVGSLLGAGAHIVTDQLLRAAGEQGFTFLSWLWLGLPLAVVSSHLACELILWRFTRRDDRSTPLRMSATDIGRSASTAVTGPLSTMERRAGVLLGGVILLWATEPLHHLSPALVALIGAFAAVDVAIVGPARCPDAGGD